MFRFPVVDLTFVLFVGCCALALAASSSTAVAQTEPSAARVVERAYESYLEADFTTAQQRVDAALADPRLSPALLARVHALSAVLASLDRARAPSAVEAEIEIAVALDHGVALPDGASRVVRDAFDAVRAREAEAPARIAMTTVLSGAERTVEAHREHVPAALTGRVMLACTSDEGRSSAGGEAGASLVVGALATACEAALETPAGQRVLVASLELARTDAGMTARDDTVLYVVIGVVAAVLIGAGIAIGVALSPSGDDGLGAPAVLEW